MSLVVFIFVVLCLAYSSSKVSLVTAGGLVNPPIQSLPTFCHPFQDQHENSSRLLLESFLLEQWAFALKSLSLGNDALFQDMKTSMGSHVHNFNNFQSGCNVYMYGRNSTPITYCKIWKNANEAIRANLFSLVVEDCPRTKRCPAKYKESAFYPRPVIEIGHFNSMDNLVKRYSHDKISSATSLFKLFTFARDPLQHFISGLTESVFRTAYSGVPKSKNLRDIKIKDISMYITRFLEGKPSDTYLPQLIQKEHFFPMAGTFLEWPIHYIGSLEDFDSHWGNIRSFYGIQEHFNMSLGREKSTGGRKDPNNVRKGFAQLTSEDPRYMRALCHMLMLDYVCFPNYKLPEPCQDMENTHRKKGMEIFHRNKTQKD